jgi:hypothetical protein
MTTMKEILFSQLINGKKLLYLSILATFSMIAYFNVSIGYVMSPDSFGYSRWADDLIKLDFNLYDYFVQNTFFTPSYFYTTPVMVVALLKVFFGSAWQYAFLVFDLFLVLLSLVLFSKSLLIIGVRPVLISITMAVLALSVDLLLWPRYILSDTIFSFLVILASYIVIKGVVEGKFHYLSLITVLVITLVTRPSSLPILFAIFSFIAISRFQIYTKPKLLLLLFILAFFVVSPFIFAYLHHLIEVNLSNNIQGAHLLRLVGQGEIINDRPETWLSPPSTFSDVAYLYFVRMLSFFTPYAAPFSTIHIVLNSLQTVIILLSITIWSFLGGSIKLLDKTVFFILLLSFSVAAFHAFTIIDYDWRYRFPIILPLMMIFPISMEIFFKKIISE